MNDVSAIEIDGLTKQYGSGEREVTAVDGLDLDVKTGEVFGFLGPNGAGKSTTINMLLDYVHPTEGRATILGHDVHENAQALRHHIGVLPEGLGLYDRLSGRRHLEFAIDWMDADDDPDTILDRIGLSAVEADRAVATYSKGMQQRLALGMAVVGDPELLILDEPSSGLDPHGIREMRELVRAEASKGTTVFFSSHILGQVEAVCDRVGILDDGQLVAVNSVEALRRTVGAGTELRLRVDGENDVDLAGIEGVRNVEHSGGLIRVTTADPRVKAQVITTLTTAGVEVLDLDSEEPSLEDVFTAYTSGDEQDRSPEKTTDGQEVVG